MIWQAVSFDWNQARAFLATAEEGSLSAAARALGQTQPTLGRQIAALEAALGVTLFERVGRSLALTETGQDLLKHVRDMNAAAGRLSLAASSQSEALTGRVVITATSVVATHHIIPVLTRLRDVAPGLEIEIVTSNKISDLVRREADIAIRHARPEQPELIGKLAGETGALIYASSAYLDRIGRPTRAEDLTNAEFIGFDDPEIYIPILNEKGLSVSRRNFPVSTANGTAYFEYVRRGLGIGVLTAADAATAPELEPVLADFDPFPVPVWIVAHRELRTSRRIRLVFDIVAEEVAKQFAAGRIHP